jgi:hypothetical protein
MAIGNTNVKWYYREKHEMAPIAEAGYNMWILFGLAMMKIHGYFEVEHIMDVTRSLNRLAQLQFIYVKLFIAAPNERVSKFEIAM